MSRTCISSLTPESAHSADSRIYDTLCKLKDTPKGGETIGVIQPIWNKAIESDMRLAWMRDMLKKGLVVRDIESFGEKVNEKLRTESSREEEIGRDTLIEMMRVKCIDEKRYNRECVKAREEVKNWIRSRTSRRRFRTIMEKMRTKEDKLRRELKQKYNNKTKHLETEREREKMEKLQIVPEGLEKFSESYIFHKERIEALSPEVVEIGTVGEVQIYDDEKCLLKLNPKFAMMKRLREVDMEQDTEMCAAKIRYEVR